MGRVFERTHKENKSNEADEKINTTFMKRLFITFILFTIAYCVFSQNTVTHIVQRAETIQSIAKTYGVSVTDIQNANSDVKNVLYVGMKLSIPTPQSHPIIEEKSNFSSPSETSSINVREEYSESDYQGCGWITFETLPCVYQTSGYFDPDFNWGFSIGFGYRYYFHNNFFAEGLAGYSCQLLGSYQSETECTRHSIVFPIHLGAVVPCSDKFRIGLVVGPRINVPMKEIYKIGEIEINTPKKTYVYFDLGVDLKFSDWGIRPMVGIGLNKGSGTLLSLGVTAGF